MQHLAEGQLASRVRNARCLTPRRGVREKLIARKHSADTPDRELSKGGLQSITDARRRGRMRRRSEE